MRIGLSYNLRNEFRAAGFSAEETAEFDDEETIEALERTLHRLGFATERIGHARQLAAELVDGKSWDLVFNIAEGTSGFGREAQVPAILDAYHIPYTFSDPLVLALSLHKGMTKHVVRGLGVPTPDFSIVTTAMERVPAHLGLPLFAKPVAEGSSKGVSASSVIRTCQDLDVVCGTLLEAYGQPVLVETFLPGRELTVGIVGTGRSAKALGVMEIQCLDDADGRIYSYEKKVNYKAHVRYCCVDDATARQAIRLALNVWRGLGCRDAGRVDLRCDVHDAPYFLEVNPLPGLHPEHSDLAILCGLQGIPYDRLIQMIMESALRRIECVVDVEN